MDRRRLATALVLLVAGLGAASPAAARRGVCGTVGSDPAGPRVAVLSAFPAELAPLVAAATVTETLAVDGRIYYLGTLAGVRVVLGLTGIGLVNAEAVARDVLRRFRPRAVLFSGVAGTPERIGDVVVADTWRFLENERRRYRANPALLALARRAAGAVTLERCTDVPSAGGPVCMPYTPMVSVGGEGRSEDPFGGEPLACVPGGGDVFGCEVADAPDPERAAADPAPTGTAEYPYVIDMETAAVARWARRRRVPFVAFRGTSDGAGDPLGLPGFPSQFFAYYPLAAVNAATATTALLEHLAVLADGEGAGRRVCGLLARRRWRRAAKRLERAAATIVAPR